MNSPGVDKILGRLMVCVFRVVELFVRELLAQRGLAAADLADERTVHWMPSGGCGPADREAEVLWSMLMIPDRSPDAAHCR